MTVYLINKHTNEIIQTLNNVTKWSYDFVEYDDNGRAKSYCNTDTEYYSDEKPIEQTETI